jgi:hypothetical protein
MRDYEDHDEVEVSVENSFHEIVEIAPKRSNNLTSYFSRCNPKNLFQTKRKALECTVFSIMLISLLLAIIVPLVWITNQLFVRSYDYLLYYTTQIVYSLVDDEINSQVVVDSPNAPSYSTWQTNANNDVSLSIY